MTQNELQRLAALVRAAQQALQDGDKFGIAKHLQGMESLLTQVLYARLMGKPEQQNEA